jgi:hypothetical protein
LEVVVEFWRAPAFVPERRDYGAARLAAGPQARRVKRKLFMGKVAAARSE